MLMVILTNQFVKQLLFIWFSHSCAAS